MPNSHLPPEILDYILDLLRSRPETLKECCLVSKSWVPRTRKYLFAKIGFFSDEDLESWIETFPDPSNSPTYHTHALIFRCPGAFVRTDLRVGGLIQTFPRVVRLELTIPENLDRSEISLVPFHNFSPSIKSLHVCFVFLQCPQVFDLIRSFPVLEDLALSGYSLLGNNPHGPQTDVLSASPVFTGSLELTMPGGMENATRRLLDRPDSLRFQKFVFSWFHEKDLQWMTELVARCFDTLECLNVKCYPSCAFDLVPHRSCNLPSSVVDSGQTSIDLSKATKLGDVVFGVKALSVDWVTMTLKTVTSKHRNLQRISIHVPYDFTLVDACAHVGQTVREVISRPWLDLDRLLVQFWELRSIRPKVILAPKRWMGKQEVEYCVGCLLPEITKRGIINLIGYNES